MTDVTGVPFEVLSDVLSDPAAVLFGLEAEFAVLSVERAGPAAVKLIIEQAARGAVSGGLWGAVGDGEGPAAAADQRSSRVRSAGGAVVAKRRLACLEDLCPRRSFTQTSDAIRPRARVSERLRDKVAQAIAGGNRAVSEVAVEYGVSWPTAHKALISAAARWLPAPEPTSRLGIDKRGSGRSVGIWRGSPGSGPTRG